MTAALKDLCVFYIQGSLQREILNAWLYGIRQGYYSIGDVIPAMGNGRFKLSQSDRDFLHKRLSELVASNFNYTI